MTGKYPKENLCIWQLISYIYISTHHIITEVQILQTAKYMENDTVLKY